MPVKDGDIVYWLNNSLYLNITNRCSNKCYFCFRHFWDGIAGFRLKLNSEPSAKQIIRELENHVSRKMWNDIVFCGFGEPTVRLDCIIEVAKWIRKYYPFLKVKLNTNGHAYLLNPGRNVIGELREAGIDAVSISLNGHDKETYSSVCRPEFEDAYESVIKFIQGAKEAFKEVEVTAVNIPEIDVSRIQDLAQRLNVKFRIRDFIQCIY